MYLPTCNSPEKLKKKNTSKKKKKPNQNKTNTQEKWYKAGADPGILVRGAWSFFSKVLDLGAVLMPQLGLGRKLLSFSDFRSEI